MMRLQSFDEQIQKPSSASALRVAGGLLDNVSIQLTTTVIELHGEQHPQIGFPAHVLWGVGQLGFRRKFRILRNLKFGTTGRAGRISRSLAAVAAEPRISLATNFWRLIAEDVEVEEQ